HDGNRPSADFLRFSYSLLTSIQALDARPGTNNIILKKRTGIFRLALHTGTPLVPVFVFGESDLYYQVRTITNRQTDRSSLCASNGKGSLLRKVQELFLSKFKVAPPLVWGTGMFGCPVGVCPRAVPLHVVTGTPIPVPLIKDPSKGDVAKYQELYQRELVKLYAEHEQQYYEEIVPEHLRPKVRPILRVVAYSQSASGSQSAENTTVGFTSLVNPIVIKGNRFFDSVTGAYFPVRGVNYYPRPNAGPLDANNLDLFSNDFQHIWQRDLPQFTALSANAIRLYAVDPDVDHSAFMCALQA
ncbi:hypothetical protein BBJ28_00025085, partial [Nothophytophthora sp. Chile5]